MEISKEELVNLLDEFLYGWEFKDILRASGGKAKLGAFILAACFIDAMAGFYAGIDKSESRRNSSQRFKDFAEKYLTQYDATKLWEDLRCGLVHAYAAGANYTFTDNHSDLHGITHNGKIVLNLENFIADICRAYRKLIDDILTNPEVFAKAKRRYLSIGLMGREIN